MWHCTIGKIRKFIWGKTTAWYKTKELKSFVKAQNAIHFKPMGIVLECEPKAHWLAISFEDDKSFEKEIVERRIEYSQDVDKTRLREMRRIL